MESMLHARVEIRRRRRRWHWLGAVGLFALLAGCASAPSAPDAPADPVARLAWVDRITWGATPSTVAAVERQGPRAWLAEQLRPGPARLPEAAQARIDAMTIGQVPIEQIAASLETLRRAPDGAPDDEARKAARAAYLEELARLNREAQQRFLLRALYSPNQLQEQMTWFWMNHFNVNARKGNLRGLIGDYEEVAIRPHALGRFRDLLGATARHPAMLLYLDNARNVAGRANENYARELMELHTLGVDGGYSQADVQSLARVLTGLGVDLRGAGAPARSGVLRQGLFVFDPRRHDDGPKTFLGQPLVGHGLAEVDEALDRLARSPATARHVSRQLALYFVSDHPSPALVARMADTFVRSDGDIARVLATMFDADEFRASLGGKFRDPVHYVVAAVRLACDEQVATRLEPMLGWLQRLGQPLYGHETPDGYALTEDAWASAGQMNARFDVARAIGGQSSVLLRAPDDAAPARGPIGPIGPMADSPLVRARLPAYGAATRAALAQAATPQEFNTLLLASPELMRR